MYVELADLLYGQSLSPSLVDMSLVKYVIYMQIYGWRYYFIQNTY